MGRSLRLVSVDDYRQNIIQQKQKHAVNPASHEMFPSLYALHHNGLFVFLARALVHLIFTALLCVM